MLEMLSIYDSGKGESGKATREWGWKIMFKFDDVKQYTEHGLLFY